MNFSKTNLNPGTITNRRSSGKKIRPGDSAGDSRSTSPRCWSGFVVRQVAQDNGLQRAENGAVGSHAQRERQDGDRREPGVAEKRPDRVTKVLQEGAHVSRLLRRRGVLKRWLPGEADALGISACARKPLASCVLVLWVAALGVAHADATDDFIRAQMKRQNIPGLSLAVVKDGVVMKAAGYGVADLEGQHAGDARDGLQDRLGQQAVHRDRNHAARARGPAWR